MCTHWKRLGDILLTPVNNTTITFMRRQVKYLLCFALKVQCYILGSSPQDRFTIYMHTIIIGPAKQEKYWRKIIIFFLPINLNTCLGCSKEPSHSDGTFEHPKHMFWLRNKYKLCTLYASNPILHICIKYQG